MPWVGGTTQFDVLSALSAGPNQMIPRVVEPNSDTESLMDDLVRSFVVRIDLFVRAVGQGSET